MEGAPTEEEQAAARGARGARLAHVHCAHGEQRDAHQDVDGVACVQDGLDRPVEEPHGGSMCSGGACCGVSGAICVGDLAKLVSIRRLLDSRVIFRESTWQALLSASRVKLFFEKLFFWRTHGWTK